MIKLKFNPLNVELNKNKNNINALPEYWQNTILCSIKRRIYVKYIYFSFSCN